MSETTQMTPAEREKFYDDEIAPALAALSKQCQERGLGFLAVVEFDANEAGESAFGRTFAWSPGNSASLKWFDTFVRANANFDRYCMAFTRYVVGDAVPHSSIYLNQLGIKPEPADRKARTPA